LAVQSLSRGIRAGDGSASRRLRAPHGCGAFLERTVALERRLKLAIREGGFIVSEGKVAELL